MKEKIVNHEQAQDDTSNEMFEMKKSFTEPKLTFIEPMLTKQGDATEITAGFFGPFSPK